MAYNKIIQTDPLISHLVKPKNRRLTVGEDTALLFLSSVLIFPRSFVIFKLAFLVIFLITYSVTWFKEKRWIIHFRVLLFYLIIAMFGLVWSVVGVINGGYVAGIIDYLRLYVIWSGAFIIIFNLLLQRNAFLVFHKSIVTAGFFVTAINIFALFNNIYQLDLIPESVLAELLIYIGFHEGYIQITSHNIGSLFFIVGYLVAIQFRKDMNYINNTWSKCVLLLCLSLVIISGRRALWLAISLLPFLILLLTIITKSYNQLMRRKFLLLYIIVSLIPIIIVLYFIISGDYVSNSSLSHLQEAFSANDERSIQKEYLLNGFRNFPIFGSGYGVYAGYTRSFGSPWLYELTYNQMLFNYGIFGILMIIILIAIYLYYSVAFIRMRHQYSGIAFGFLMGIASLSLGAYSNPYFGSFDFLLLLGTIPMISASFRTNNQREYIVFAGSV